MKPIPISAAQRIAQKYGYTQVIIFARNVKDIDEKNNTCTTVGEHMTTYGASLLECRVAARIGDALKKFMGWSLKK
jgi:hypothetical protein